MRAASGIGADGPRPGGTVLRDAVALAGAAWRIWRREAAGVVGVRVRTVDAGIAVALVAAAALAAAVSALVAGLLGGGLALPPEVDRAPYLRLTAAAVIGSAGLVHGMLAATRPQGGALADLAAVLPVRPAARAIGERAPVSLLGLVASLLLAAPALTVLVLLERAAPEVAAAAVAVHLGLLAAGAVGVPALSGLLRAAADRLRLPSAYAAAASIVLVLAGTAALVAPALATAPRVPGPLERLSPIEAVPVLLATGGAQSPTAGERAVAAAALAGALVVAVVLALLDARRSERPVHAEWTRLLVGAPVPRGPFAGVAVELLHLVRLPQYLVIGLGPVLVAVALGLPEVRRMGAVPEALGGIPLLVPFAVAAFGYGATRRTGWWVRATGRSPAAQARDRLAAAALAGAAPVAASTAILLGSGAVLPGDAVARLCLGPVLGLAGATAGILAPCTPASPISSSVTGAAALLLFAAAVLPLQLAIGALAPGLELAGVGVSAVGLAALWAVVVRRRRDDDLVIA